MPDEADPGGLNLRLRACEAAVPAIPVAEVSVEHAVIIELAGAARAAREVRGAVDACAAVPGVPEAVEDPRVLEFRRQVGEAGIVCVEHQRGVARQRPQALLPAAGEVVEFEIAVHLVTEDVGEDQGCRPDLCQDLRQRSLVHLEQPGGSVIAGQVAGTAGVGQQRTHQTGGLVRALLVEDRVQTGRPHHPAEHAARRSLPVGPGHDHGAARDLPGQAGEQPRVDGQRGHSWNGGPVAAAEPADRAPCRLPHGDREGAPPGRRGPGAPYGAAVPRARFMTHGNANGFPRRLKSTQCHSVPPVAPP